MKDESIKEKEYYREKIIEMVKEIENFDYIFKIYHYTIAKYKRLRKETED